MPLNALFCCFKKHAQKSTEPDRPQAAVRHEVVRRDPEPKLVPQAAPKPSTNGTGTRAGGRTAASRPPRAKASISSYTSSTPATTSSDYMLYTDFGGSSYGHHSSHGGGHCGGHSSYDSGGGGYSGGGDSGGGGGCGD